MKIHNTHFSTRHRVRQQVIRVTSLILGPAVARYAVPMTLG